MKKQIKTFLALLCVFACILSLAVPALAAGYSYQGKQGQTLLLQSPSDITVISEEGYYLNTINTPLNGTQDISLKFTMSSGMNNFSEKTFLSVNLPQITVCDTYGGTVVANPTYVSGSSDGIELVIPANTLTDGSYVLVFGKDIQANKAEKTLGQDIVFQFTVSADAAVPTEPAEPEEPAAVDCPYTDVSPDCAAAVMAMVEKGYLTAESDTLLGAARPVTRGEFLSLLGRCRNINAGKYTASSYQDVENADPAMPYIEWATAKGIVKGYGDGLFGASDLLTREQAACILHAYAVVFEADNQNASTSIGAFADSKQVSSWAKDAVKWAVAAGALTADDANRLNPGAQVSREEMAALVYAAAGVK